MNRGYLALYRKIQDHPFYKEKRVFSKYEAWIDLLMEVQHSLEAKKVLIGMKVVECGHGQSVKSLRTWGDRWGWSAKKVSRYFKLLEEMEQICLENVTVTTRLTVLNYEKYDPKCHIDVTEGKHKGNANETEGKHECPTDKNVNKEKNVKKFIKPTIQEIADYCTERKNGVDPVKFFNHYESVDWMRGKNKIKNWKACVVTWEKGTKKQDGSESWRKAL